MGTPLTGLGAGLTYDGVTLVWPGPAPLPGLGPLINSFDSDEVEAQLKAAFVDVFESALRDQIARINAYGTPHQGDIFVIERFVKHAGLALERDDYREGYMRELLRGWASHNPRRGLHFLRFYLRLLWPGLWTLDQLWQDPGRPYPEGSSPFQTPGSYLTSRARLILELAGDDDGSKLSRLMPIFRSVIPARMVLEVATVVRGEGAARVAMIADEGLDHEDLIVTAAP
jgi:hypothetical protein